MQGNSFIPSTNMLRMYPTDYNGKGLDSMAHKEFTNLFLSNRSDYVQKYSSDLVFQYFAKKLVFQTLSPTPSWTPDSIWNVGAWDNRQTLIDGSVQFQNWDTANWEFNINSQWESYRFKAEITIAPPGLTYTDLAIYSRVGTPFYNLDSIDGALVIEDNVNVGQTSIDLDNGGVLTLSTSDNKVIYTPNDTEYARYSRDIQLSVGSDPITLRSRLKSRLNGGEWEVEGEVFISTNGGQEDITFEHFLFTDTNKEYYLDLSVIDRNGSFVVNSDVRTIATSGVGIVGNLVFLQNGSEIYFQQLNYGQTNVDFTFQGLITDDFIFRINRVFGIDATINIKNIEIIGESTLPKSARICTDGVIDDIPITLLNIENQIDNNIGLFEISLIENNGIKNYIELEVGDDKFLSEPFQFVNETDLVELKPQGDGLEIGLFWYPNFTPSLTERIHFSAVGKNEAEIVEGQRSNYALKNLKQLTRKLTIEPIPEYMVHLLDEWFSVPVYINNILYVKSEEAEYNEIGRSGLYTFEITVRRTNYDRRVLTNDGSIITPNFLLGNATTQFLIGQYD